MDSRWIKVWAIASAKTRPGDAAIWTLLPARAKVRRVEHHPALVLCRSPTFMEALRAQEGTSARTLEFAILTATRKLAAIRQGDFVFPGGKAGRPLSNMALLMTLRRMGQGDLTAPGFRSSFRDWAAERTGFPAEVAEMALAQAVGDKVEAAYRRGDLFQKRRQLTDAWAKFCAAQSVAGRVVPLRQPAAAK